MWCGIFWCWWRLVYLIPWKLLKHFLPLVQFVSSHAWGGTVSVKWQYLCLRSSSQTPPIWLQLLLPSCWIHPPVRSTCLFLWSSIAPTHLNPNPSSAKFVSPPNLPSPGASDPMKKSQKWVKKESVEALNLHGHFTQRLLNSDCAAPQTKSNRGLIWSSHPHFSCCVSLRTPCTSSSLGACDKTLKI